ncbi:MAG: tRNA pseudouridine(55) synthase TruB [Acidobacteria bacterium]|nr:tRNA pseudouridine(55) synthase TruB [Acidobacteriota bacterium]
MQPGLHLVHKPVGITSFQVVRAAVGAARAAGEKKPTVGHGGTLDPFAHGLLLLLEGQATRLMECLHPIPKGYVAEVAWGLETDTGDPQGQAVFRGPAETLEVPRMEAALAAFLGWHDQVPPATSAKKIEGEAAYRKAHRGEEVLLPPSRVFLHRARWIEHRLPATSLLELSCRGGFYVRSLARDLGRALGCGAHLAGLHRTRIGPWEDPGPEGNVWVRGRGLLPWCTSRELEEAEALDLAQGRPIPLGETRPPDGPLPEDFPDPAAPILAFQGDRLLALLREREGRLWTYANLRGGL